jgi:ribose transport system permease protein
MKKLIGLTLFLVVLYLAVLAGLWMSSGTGGQAPQTEEEIGVFFNKVQANNYNLMKRAGLFGIITLGAGLLIVTGGIDLSIGSVVGLSATALAILLGEWNWHPVMACTAVLLLGATIGLVQGGLVTWLRLQPFVVTLCGLFIFRGAARWISGDQVKGLGAGFGEMKSLLYRGDILGMPKFLVIFLILAAVFGILLHWSIYGRYWFAIGGNERAALYSGVPTQRYKLAAYVICSTLAAGFGILFLMEQNSALPSQTGSFFELYAIAGAVLGGFSLRGGEGNIFGILVGTAILVILPNFTNMWGVKTELEYTVIGSALLFGAVMDELLRRRVAKQG